MLGLSLGKILLVVMVIVLVWRGKRLLFAVRDKLAEAERHRAPAPRPGNTASRSDRTGGGDATTLVECPRCGLYVPNGTICRSREECRYREGSPAA